MGWYAAHVISAIKYIQGEQNVFPVYESIVLINSESVCDAFKQAIEYGANYSRAQEGSNLRLNGCPAKSEFIGVRAVNEILDDLVIEKNGVNESIALEVTWIEYEIDNLDKLHDLANGLSLTAKIVSIDKT